MKKYFIYYTKYGVPYYKMVEAESENAAVEKFKRTPFNTDCAIREIKEV